MNARIRVAFQRIFGQFGLLDNLYYTLSDPFRRISRAHRPANVAFNLIWPLYRLHYPLPASPLPLEILARPEIGLEYLYRDGHYHQLRSIWLFTIRDTPLRSLYRLCVSICAQELDEIRLESAYFWRHSDWPIQDIPDPKDPDPVRYAVLASLVEELANAFNEKIENGLRRGMELYEIDYRALAREENKPLETCPGWALQVPALEQQVDFGRDRSRSMPVWRRNILADANQLRNY
ncbi:DNA-binding protein [Ceratobasidium sp. AG-Ba]|nr:DNA-binding protein [Ceratobasidium sp. AG-Ba]QRW14995.1 DNA-binding protein [Ceratobasidium sp. AG-Ba]